MKRILLPTIFCFVLTVSSYAALNPYAYGLSSTLSQDGNTLTVNYSLNATATSVKVVILNGETIVETIDCSDEGLTNGAYSVDIPTNNLPTGYNLTWKIEVKGASVEIPTIQSDVFKFYLPYGMDVDIDTESDYFGRWYVIEATNGGQSKSGYQSNPLGRGLYAFDAALNPIKNANDTYGFNNYTNIGATETNVNSDYTNLYRVATSGGRVFIGKFRDGHASIIEADPANLNNAFTNVLNNGSRAVSIDARGQGENLKLVMLDTDFNITEYDLGTASSISSASRTFNKGELSIVRDDASITYDNEGGIWLNQHRADATTTCPTIAHISPTNGFDYNNVSNSVTHNKTSNSGIAINPDGTELAVVGPGTTKITIYGISKDSNGNISLSEKYTIATAGNNHTALSYDYAGNLYVANRSKETITFYAMPYSGEITTPAASKYSFTLKGPELNIYASSLTCNNIDQENRKITISYLLNAPATALEFQLLNKKSAIIKTVAITNTYHLFKGKHDNVVIDLGKDLPADEYTWQLKTTAETNDVITQVTTNKELYNFYSPAGMVIDNCYDSPYFGRIYISECREGEKTTAGRTTEQGIYIFGPELTDITNQGNSAYDGGVNWNEDKTIENAGPEWVYGMYAPARLAVDEEGYVYICDNGAPSKETSGVWRMDPSNPNTDFEEILETNKRGNTYTRVNSIAVSGKGEDKMLYIIDNNTSNYPILKKYAIGNTSSYSNPGINLVELGIMHSLNTLIRGIHNDFWIFQFRGQIDAIPSICHYNSSLTKDYEVTETSNSSIVPETNPNRRGVGAISPDGKLLAFHGEQAIYIYDISYDNNKKPSLDNLRKITGKTGSNVDCIAFDVANNIYFASASKEYFYAYALPKTENTFTTPAPSSQKITIEAPNPTNVIPRITAHNLDVNIDGIYYNFSFDANTNADSGKIVFYDASDEIVDKIDITQTIIKGKNEVKIPMNEIASKDDLQWGIELTAKTMEPFICRYNHTWQPQFQLYFPQDLVVDNNPQSDYFGRIYVTYPKDGNDCNKQLGILVYDHAFNILAEGLKPTGMTFGNNERRKMHRIKIGSNGNIYFVDSDNNKIYEMIPAANDPILHDNGAAKNVIANTSEITKANEFCFADDGTMFVLNNPSYNQSTNAGAGILYKIVDGIATQHVTFADETDNIFTTIDNSIEVDGRGGIWMCQGRDHWDKFPPLIHINSDGDIDFQININSNDAIKNLFPQVNADLATRGSMAYNTKENILAFGGGGYITLFKVNYDVNNAPTLTKWLVTPYVGDRIDGIYFDYAGNLFAMSATSERFYAFAIPQATNKVSVRAKNSKTVHKIIPLEETKDNTSLLIEYKDNEEDIYVFRSLRAGMYNTLCLPFNVNSFINTPIEDATVVKYVGANIENDGIDKEIFLNFQEVTNIEAGKPYLVMPTTDITGPMTFEGVTISVTEGSASTTSDAVTFKGILHPTLLTANDKRILFLIENNNLAWANITNNMNGMRAYFKVNDPSLMSARTRAYIRKSPTVTTNIETTSIGDKNAVQKILYKENIYIIRNEEIYTIQGRKVK